MKKYKFKLENVLKVRNLRQKMAERDLAATQVRKNRNQEEQQKTEEDLNRSFNFLHQDSQNLPFWNEVTMRYQNALRQRQGELKEQEQKIDEQLNKDKTVLQRRQRDVKVIDKLKEYDQAAYLRFIDQETQKEIEEIDILKRGNRS
jgi:hypothetical protein